MTYQCSICNLVHFVHAVVNISIVVQNELMVKQSLSSRVAQLEDECKQLQVSLHDCMCKVL